MNNLGATGKFPKGKIRPDDEGELRFAVGQKNGEVLIDFGKSVAWIAMPPEMARTVANALIAAANVIEGKR